MYSRPGHLCATWQTGSHPLTFLPKPAILKGHKRGDPLSTYYVAQRQPDTDGVQILWECVSEVQAQDEVDRINFNLGHYGIPSDYYAFVTT